MKLYENRRYLIFINCGLFFEPHDFLYLLLLEINKTQLYMPNVHLNILIQLAKIDGVVVQEEIDLINEIGKAKGLTDEQISACYDEHYPIEDLKQLTDDEKFEYIYSIVQLMKIDGRLYDEEIKFCGKLAAKLGYNEEVLFELMLKIYSDPHICAEKLEIKKQIQPLLIK